MQTKKFYTEKQTMLTSQTSFPAPSSAAAVAAPSASSGRPPEPGGGSAAAATPPACAAQPFRSTGSSAPGPGSSRRGRSQRRCRP